MPRMPSAAQKEMIGTDELLMLFVEKYPTVEAAIEGGYEDIYGLIVEWLYDHGSITSEDHEILWR